MGLGFVKNIGKGAVNLGKSAVNAGKSTVDKAKDVGGAAVDKAKDVGGAAVDKAKDAGGAALDKAKDVGKDAVHLSKEALEWKTKQEKNFAHGVLEWGKGTVDTVVGIAKNPVATAKAVGKLATNPVLNPIGGTAVALAQGKNPIEAYKDGAGQLKDIGKGLLDGYKDVYKEHGIAGLAGNIAPDIAIALATGGTGAAAKGAGTTAARAVATEVAEGVATQAVRTTTREVAEEVVESSVRQTVKTAAKDIGKELLPGPEDIIDQARRQDNKDEKPGSIFDFFG